ncbi:2-amino-4-hydroxy-6-hydroxymethyldihydropteridinepyrophosphokinase [Commensalibacter sp. Nvir]|uniref:2-amino-4-hydroxy-6- hydroxymethyldihydropteridine diphosphokinase n=1 Tax=Commensalibacter sp. Nvir TaxID=3069817 RepID=UPI002D37C558|nr:2-amino-4-hydroxy-6-hydroxymethyldihydropteridinepyrophosphokinase [Commensalibacter sp. Nvir]
MIIIAVGSNLSGQWGNSPYDMCQEAIKHLQFELQCAMNISTWYKTKPIPSSSQPFYINGVVAFEKKIDALALLLLLNNIEKKSGRKRIYRNEARPLDLDIIDFNRQIICKGPKLVTPHLRLHLRKFVLYPLRDVCPQWVHPVLNKSVNQLIEALPDQHIIPYKSRT